MTSPASPSILPHIHLVPLSSIFTPDDRYKLGDWDEANCEAIRADLASDRSGGLLSPIILSDDPDFVDRYVLRAGGHRLEAFRRLAAAGTPCSHPAYSGWSLIPALIGINFSEADWEARKITENYLRKTPNWFLCAKEIHAYHIARVMDDSRWSMNQTALLLGIDRERVSVSIRAISLWNSKDEGDIVAAKAIQDAPSLLAAKGILTRREERKAAEAATVTRAVTQAQAKQEQQAAMVVQTPVEPGAPLVVPGVETPATIISPTLSILPEPPTSPILHLSLEDYTKTYSGPAFNFIHCDPPYGQNHCESSGQSARGDYLTYEDDTQALWRFLSALSGFASRHVAASAHMVMWFPVDLSKLSLLQSLLPDLFPGWSLFNEPFIWPSPRMEGRVVDTQRTGRKTYEWALLFSRGDRKIVRVKELHFLAEKGRDTKIHTSEKPFQVCRHICEMFVDDTTRAIDPTAGSGRPLQAIHSLGAGSVIGLEKEEPIWKEAVRDWERYERESGAKRLGVL